MERLLVDCFEILASAATTNHQGPEHHHLHIVCHFHSTLTLLPRSNTSIIWRAMLLHQIGRTIRPCHRIETTPTKTFIRHRSYLAPPFLLDTYTPRYQLLTSVEASKKRSQAYAHLRNCNLCPRLCGVNRFERRGTCLIGKDVTVNTIAPHFGEEPSIQGWNGSGSVFFSGCNLRCVFCQNHVCRIMNLIFGSTC